MTASASVVNESQIDALLPQTQCTRCGYAGCRPYAAAIVAGAAQINQCPPGGAETIAALAALLDRPVLALNPENGRESPPTVAWIDPERCIGCAKCLPPCPVDAILGAPKFLHTVLYDRCTGCELCVAPCPVDCIEMRPAPSSRRPTAHENRRRYEAHGSRLARQAEARRREIAAKKAELSRGAGRPA
jgi:electron transport complex protein RnfB